jgi:hypothetical protein
MRRRTTLLVSFGAAVLLGGCGDRLQLRACTADAGASTCAAGFECLWLASGGYFCVARCVDGSCPSGGSCRSGGASSCATCQDLIDVCE